MPIYTHSCDSCEYLGSYHNSDEQLVDLYYCVKCDGGTFIARYGNEGSEYSSMPLNVMMYAGLDSTHPLIEALRRKSRQWYEAELAKRPNP